MTVGNPANWHAPARVIPSSSKFNADVPAPWHTERYASLGISSLSEVKSETVSGAFFQSFNNNPLWDGSSVDNAPWHARWTSSQCLIFNSTSSFTGAARCNLFMECGMRSISCLTSCSANGKSDWPGVCRMETNIARGISLIIPWFREWSNALIVGV